MAFSNTTVPGLKLWLDAAVGVTQSGGIASLWADQSGHGNDASVSAGAVGAQLDTNIVNGLPGLNSFYNAASPGVQMGDAVGRLLADGSPYHIVSVVRMAPVSAGFNPGGFDIGGGFADIGIGLLTVFGDYGGDIYVTPSSFTPNTGIIANDNPYAFEFSSDGTTQVASVDGTALSLTSTTPEIVSGASWNVFGDPLGGNATFWGWTCEFLVFDHALLPAELQQVHAYLQDKYAISLGVTPTSISPTTATVVTSASQTFVGSNGSGTGYVYSLPVNNSGGSINSSTGVYTAGTTGYVSDTVRVTDSVGGIADATVTVTPSHAFTNTTVPGLAQWIDAGVGLNIGAGTWADQSGNGHDCTTVTGTPTLNASSVNGKPGVTFDGASYFQGPTNPLASGSDREIFFVIKPTGAPGLYACWRNSPPSWIADSRAIGSDSYIYDDATSATKALGFLFSTGTPYVTNYQSTVGALVGISINGAAQTVSGAAVTADTGASGFTIGAFYGAVLPMIGDICEVLVFDHVLSSGDRQQVNAYLQDKYAIGLGITPTSISPTSATVAPSASQTFTGADGSGTGYSYSISVNNSGGTINASTGVYTAGTTGSVTDTVTVTDSVGGTANAIVTVAGGVGLSISPTSVSLPPRGTQTFAGSGGTAPYTYSLFANNSGGSINSSTGAYVAGHTGSVTDTVRVTDSLSATADATVSVGPGVSLSPPGGRTMLAGQTQVFVISGGSGTGYNFDLSEIFSGGNVNDGTGLYTAGPTTNIHDTIVGSDSLGNFAFLDVHVVDGPPLTISPDGHTPISVAPRQGISFSATGGTGTGYVWSFRTNDSGGSINASTGAYTAGTTPNTTDYIQVLDSNSNVDYAIIQVGASLSISPTSVTLPPSGSQTFSYSGGGGTFAFSISVNNSGGSINSSTGVYTAGHTGGVTDTVRVTDSYGNTAEASVHVTTSLTITPTTFECQAGQGRTFAASGGSTTGYGFSLSTNNSGGSVDPTTGVYVSGASGGSLTVSDVITLTDSLGNTAPATITVHPPVPPTFFLTKVAPLGMSTIRVTFSHAPQATDPTSLTDALNPANYTIAGPALDYIIRCTMVVGDPNSVDLSLGAPLSVGSWSLTARNIKDSDGFETI